MQQRRIGLGISSSNLNRGSLSIGTSGAIFAPVRIAQFLIQQGRVHLFCHVDGGYHQLGSDAGRQAVLCVGIEIHLHSNVPTPI
jgi:hypothetical protein